MEQATEKQISYADQMINEATKLIATAKQNIDDPENYRTTDLIPKLEKLIDLKNESDIEIKSESLGNVGENMKYSDMMKYKMYASIHISMLQEKLNKFKKMAESEELI